MRIPIINKFPVTAMVFQKRGKGYTIFRDKARFMTKEGVSYYELKKYDAKFRPSSFDDFIPQTNGKPLVLLYEYQRGMLVPINASDLQVVYETDSNGELVMERGSYECWRCENVFDIPEKIETGKVKKNQKDACPYCLDTNIKLVPTNEVKMVPKLKKVINLHAIEEDMAFWGQMRRWQAEQRHKDEGFWEKYQDFIYMVLMFVFCIVMAYIFMQNISDTGENIVNALIKATGQQTVVPG